MGGGISAPHPGYLLKMSRPYLTSLVCEFCVFFISFLALEEEMTLREIIREPNQTSPGISPVFLNKKTHVLLAATSTIQL